MRVLALSDFQAEMLNKSILASIRVADRCAERYDKLLAEDGLSAIARNYYISSMQTEIARRDELKLIYAMLNRS